MHFGPCQGLLRCKEEGVSQFYQTLFAHWGVRLNRKDAPVMIEDDEDRDMEAKSLASALAGLDGLDDEVQAVEPVKCVQDAVAVQAVEPEQAKVHDLTVDPPTHDASAELAEPMIDGMTLADVERRMELLRRLVYSLA